MGAVTERSVLTMVGVSGAATGGAFCCQGESIDQQATITWNAWMLLLKLELLR